MYAVVNTGGKQAKVEEGSLVAVEKLNAKVGDKVTLPVLFIADGDKVLATPAQLAGASVTAEVLEHFKGEKQIVFKFKKRKGYKRTKGHRQVLTSVRILGIATEGKPAKAKKEEAAPKAEDAKAAKAPKAEKPKAEKAPEAAPKAAKPKAEKAAPAAVAGQCAAVKADGTQCANKAKEGSKYCGVHAKLEG
ncbi:MAG: 50S ribosomal protein L21 [Actinobacteria bacterium]|nr:50S ribosomal protein L21 [Actinomycetota bacterium]